MTERVRVRLEAEQIDGLIRSLARRGYDVLGPTVRDGAVVYDSVAGLRDLPRGHTEEQAPGRYRLKPREDGAIFGYTVGPQSWKKYLHPANVRLFQAGQAGGVFRILTDDDEPRKPYAFVGVKACELAAIALQDRVLLGGEFHDPVYGARRAQVFLVAVHCTASAETCFCESMGTGPRVSPASADITLTEVLCNGDHWLLGQPGNALGAEILEEIGARPATADEISAGEAAIDAAAAGQTRYVETEGLAGALRQNFEHPRWEKTAARCLSCGNCTMVCPTCFCTTVEDFSDVSGASAERWRRWDSCFTMSFSFIHGGSVRTSPKARYRQWATHKFAAWVDQFGSPGCVGCGRCITWCPAGIDITEEVGAIRKGGDNGNADS